MADSDILVWKPDSANIFTDTVCACVFLAAPVCIHLFAITKGNREPAISAVQDVPRLPGIQRHQEEGRYGDLPRDWLPHFCCYGICILLRVAGSHGSQPWRLKVLRVGGLHDTDMLQHAQADILLFAKAQELEARL